jgi:hypothetical protein
VDGVYQDLSICLAQLCWLRADGHKAGCVLRANGVGPRQFNVDGKNLRGYLRADLVVWLRRGNGYACRRFEFKNACGGGTVKPR